MRFSILTASLNQPDWLRCCARSVADQDGVETEHIIQDGGTTEIADHGLRIAEKAGAQPAAPRDGELVRAEKPDYALRLFSARDAGMYDALNRALGRATGDVVAILNSDEQYLPGTLAAVAALFEKHPGADIVVGDCLIVDESGGLLCFRKSTKLRPAMILTDHLYDFTCALFFRRRIIERGPRFDLWFKAGADGVWVSQLLRRGARTVHCRRYLATFMLGGHNLSLRADHEYEGQLVREFLPSWTIAAAPLLRLWRRMEKLLRGGYSSGPIDYALYARPDDAARTLFRCGRPQFRHPWAGK
jgi:glycosyltransferase involved in cell wall biosynthesis